jgi:hypothetical protein
MNRQHMLPRVTVEMSRLALMLVVLVQIAAGCSSDTTAVSHPDAEDSVIGAAYHCGAGDASLDCLVGQSFCELDTGGGRGGAPGMNDAGDGTGGAPGGATSPPGRCRQLPSACAAAPSCDCLCAVLGCSPAPVPPGCTCHGMDGQLELDCSWE